jgi:hypothetical protein
MSLTRKIEEVSFQDERNNYFDVKVHDGYIEVSINDSKDDRMTFNQEDWKQLDREIRKIFKEMSK